MAASGTLTTKTKPEKINFWGAKGAPILFSDLGLRMASCSYIYIYIYISVILQMAALTSFFTKL